MTIHERLTKQWATLTRGKGPQQVHIRCGRKAWQEYLDNTVCATRDGESLMASEFDSLPKMLFKTGTLVLDETLPENAFIMILKEVN